MSQKRRDLQTLYQQAVQTVILRDRGCAVATLWPEVKCHGKIDPHHIWTQRTYPERRCDPTAMIAACRAHHDAIHSYPIIARTRGLLK